MLNWWRPHAHNCGEKVGLKNFTFAPQMHDFFTWTYCRAHRWPADFKNKNVQFFNETFHKLCSEMIFTTCGKMYKSKCCRNAFLYWYMSKITHHVYWNIMRKKKKIGKIEILTYIYIYINAQLSYFKIPQVNTYMLNWKRARAQLKHAHAQLEACICTTEACICWYVGVKRAYAQLVACTCSQLREKSWTQKNCFCTTNARFFHLNIP